MTQEKNNPILDLNTGIDRKSIRIDGALYEMRHPNEIDLPEFHAAIKVQKKIQEFFDKDTYSAGDLARAKGQLEDTMKKIFVDIPQEVLDTVHHLQRTQVLEVFLGELLEARKQWKILMDIYEESPDSNDSTEAL